MKPYVVTILGIRPDFIRMKNILNQLDSEPDFEHISIHTGQHYDDVLYSNFLRELQIRKPNFLLEAGKKSSTQYEQISYLSKKVPDLLYRTLTSNRKHIILFLGDSHTSMLAPVLKKENFNIGHIEAGMRSYDFRMPEEINRIACDHSSSLLFCYHQNYKNNLLQENIKSERIFVVGNTIKEIVEKSKNEIPQLYHESPYILADIHRNENISKTEKLYSILIFLNQVGLYFNCNIYLTHFPRIQNSVVEILRNNNPLLFSKIVLMSKETCGSYFKYLRFQMDSLFMISDSGTAQEEAPLLGTKVVVPRNFTERNESCENNCSIMIGENFSLAPNENEKVIKKIEKFIKSKKKMKLDWLGDGKTSKSIINILKEKLQ